MGLFVLTRDQAKKIAKDRDGRHCQYENPNQTGEDDRYCNQGPLEGAHVFPVDLYDEVSCEPWNIITLCSRHHLPVYSGSLDRLTTMRERIEWLEKHCPRWLEYHGIPGVMTEVDF